MDPLFSVGSPGLIPSRTSGSITERWVRTRHDFVLLSKRFIASGDIEEYFMPETRYIPGWIGIVNQRLLSYTGVMSPKSATFLFNRLLTELGKGIDKPNEYHQECVLNGVRYPRDHIILYGADGNVLDNWSNERLHKILLVNGHIRCNTMAIRDNMISVEKMRDFISPSIFEVAVNKKSTSMTTVDYMLYLVENNDPELILNTGITSLASVFFDVLETFISIQYDIKNVIRDGNTREMLKDKDFIAYLEDLLTIVKESMDRMDVMLDEDNYRKMITYICNSDSILSEYVDFSSRWDMHDLE
jgi:hypothetical protein